MIAKSRPQSHLKTFIMGCDQTLWDVDEHYGMLWDVTECYGMLWDVMGYYGMLWDDMG